MAKYIAAISGGIDSVVLLAMLAKNNDDIIVAHVNHGIRDDSADDARFVQGLAQAHGYLYEEKQLKLGEHASEEQARDARYRFLFALAKKHDARIMTAHHADDLAETIAINLHRGTGWRGLAVLNRAGLERPLIRYSKQELYAYAMSHHLEWVEDKTNRDMRYLRNQIRGRLRHELTDTQRDALRSLRDRQVAISKEIESEQINILSQINTNRHLLIQIDTYVAIELLGTIIFTKSGIRPTRPQLERALIAIKTAKAGAVHHVGSGIALRFTSRVFSVEVL